MQTREIDVATPDGAMRVYEVVLAERDAALVSPG